MPLRPRHLQRLHSRRVSERRRRFETAPDYQEELQRALANARSQQPSRAGLVQAHSSRVSSRSESSLFPPGYGQRVENIIGTSRGDRPAIWVSVAADVEAFGTSYVRAVTWLNSDTRIPVITWTRFFLGFDREIELDPRTLSFSSIREFYSPVANHDVERFLTVEYLANPEEYYRLRAAFRDRDGVSRRRAETIRR